MIAQFYFNNPQTVYLANLYLLCVIFSIFLSLCQFLSLLSALYKKREHFAVFFSKMLSSFPYLPCY